MNDEDAIMYVPELADNRDLEPEDQTYCELYPMTAEELRAYQRAMLGIKPGSAQALKKAEGVVKRIMTERVGTITNYSDIKNQPITTGEELYARGEPALVDELYDALSNISKLKAGQRGN